MVSSIRIKKPKWIETKHLHTCGKENVVFMHEEDMQQEVWLVCECGQVQHINETAK